MLKCVMYFSEYILKYIISKVKKKKCLSPSPWIFLSHRCLEVLGTKVTGMVRAEHGGARQKVKDPANTGGGGRAGCMLLLPPGCCSDPADGSWHWRSVCGSSLHFLSHHPSNEEEHFLRLTGAQVRCFLALSTLGIQDAGLLLPRWRWAWVSRVDVFWVFTVHSWRRRSKPVSALGLSLILLPSINRNPIV